MKSVGKKKEDTATSSATKKNNLASALMAQPMNRGEYESSPDEFTVWIDHDDIIPNPKNEEEIKDIPELKASIVTAGEILHNIVVLPKENGKHMLLAGERRWTAVGELLNEGHEEYRLMPAHVKDLNDMSPEAMRMPREWREKYVIVTSNLENREDRSEAVTYKRYLQMKTLYDEWKEAGVKPPGKVRELIAEEMNVNPRTVAKFETITKKTSDDIQKSVQSGELTLNAALELSKVTPEEQKQVLEKAQQQREEKIVAAADPKEKKEAEKAIGDKEIEEAIINNYADSEEDLDNRERGKYNPRQVAPKMTQPIKVTEEEIEEAVILLNEAADCLKQLSGKEVPQSLYNTIQRSKKNLLNGAKTITKIVSQD